MAKIRGPRLNRDVQVALMEALMALREAEAQAREKADPSVCPGRCIPGDEVGLPQYANLIVSADPRCPVHVKGGPV